MFKPISRRTVLKGACATIALPWLEAMRPLTSLAASPAGAATAPKRLAFMYIPNGVIGQHWFPASPDQDYLSTQSLTPLQPVRDDLVVINGLNRTYVSGEPHSQAASCWMTSCGPYDRPDGSTAINRTLDQIIAAEAGKATPFPSLELSCNSFVDNMEPKLFDAISWYGPGYDARSENDPHKVFQRLFGDSDHFNRSVLDTVIEDAQSLRQNLGQADRRKLDEYLESVRAIERRLDHQAESKNTLGPVQFDMPDEMPANRGDYLRLMGDLMILAFQTDQTRVATLMVGPERWETPQLYDGVFEKPVQHHQMTHDDAYDEAVALIDRFHVTQYLYLINRLKASQEGEGSMLDNCLFVLGSGLGDGNSHSYEQLPTIIAGSGGGRVQTGRVIECEKGTPLSNLWLTLAREMGLQLDEFADSTGTLKEYV
ncbi:MAG: DUF1552 domain-containing protein [Pirellulaceae bacterium]